MKTLFVGLCLTLLTTLSFAQDQRTSFQHIAVVTTSAGTAAQLSWKKGDESIAYFIVEKSEDGIDFKQCGIVFLSEDPEFTDYKFRDKLSTNVSGLLYRIGIVSTQKRVYYLPVKKLVAPENS